MPNSDSEFITHTSSTPVEVDPFSSEIKEGMELYAHYDISTDHLQDRQNKLFELAGEDEEKQHQAYFFLGLVYNRNRQWQSALAHFNAAWQTGTVGRNERIDVLSQRSLSHRQLGDYQSSLSDIDRSILELSALEPSPYIVNSLANANEARQEVIELIKRRQNNIAARVSKIGRSILGKDS